VSRMRERGQAKRERVPKRGLEQGKEGVRNTEAGHQGASPGYWQAVGSTRSAVKRAKRP